MPDSALDTGVTAVNQTEKVSIIMKLIVKLLCPSKYSIFRNFIEVSSA